MFTEFESDELKKQIDNSKFVKLAQCTERILLSDGRFAEVQVVITAREDDFVHKADNIRGFVR